MSSLNISLVGPGGRACGTPPKRYPVLSTTVKECPDRLVGTCVQGRGVETSVVTITATWPMIERGAFIAIPFVPRETYIRLHRVIRRVTSSNQDHHLTVQQQVWSIHVQ